MRRTPTDFLAPEDAPDLASFDLDPARVGRFHQGVEGPMRVGFGLRRHQRPLGLADDRAGRRAFREGNDLASFRFGQAGFPPRSRPITQTVDSLGIEANNAFAYRLGMAAQFLRDRGGPQPVPASDNHPCPQNPIARRVPTLGESANLAFFSGITGIAGTQEFRHRRLPIILDDTSILRLY
jgi:hypothetical protein